MGNSQKIVMKLVKEVENGINRVSLIKEGEDASDEEKFLKEKLNQLISIKLIPQDIINSITTLKIRKFAK